MKPLSHPKMEDVTVEGILYAFSNPVRIRIYAELAVAECAQICSAYRDIAGVKLPKSTLSQHFAILRETGLIRSERKGTELHNETRCEELEKRFGPMIDSIIDAYIAQNARSRKVIQKKKRK
ncbi:MAG: winged helix-turn-helix domain-containing protein [Alphaproteobacteria bacterium]|nr:winged helix-turn-helix domain-containing protein [Alphaproteobacteria bacterium]